MRRKVLKDKQKEILNFIKIFRKQNGCSPTYQEIGDAVGLTDAGAFDAVCRLEKAGYIQRDRRPRMMKVL